MGKIIKWIWLTEPITLYLKPNNIFYSKISERCTYGKLSESQNSAFPGQPPNKKSSNLLSGQIK